MKRLLRPDEILQLGDTLEHDNYSLVVYGLAGEKVSGFMNKYQCYREEKDIFDDFEERVAQIIKEIRHG